MADFGRAASRRTLRARAQGRPTGSSSLPVNASSPPAPPLPSLLRRTRTLSDPRRWTRPTDPRPTTPRQSSHSSRRRRRRRPLRLDLARRLHPRLPLPGVQHQQGLDRRRPLGSAAARAGHGPAGGCAPGVDGPARHVPPGAGALARPRPPAHPLAAPPPRPLGPSRVRSGGRNVRHLLGLLDSLRARLAPCVCLPLLGSLDTARPDANASPPRPALLQDARPSQALLPPLLSSLLRGSKRCSGCCTAATCGQSLPCSGTSLPEHDYLRRPPKPETPLDRLLLGECAPRKGVSSRCTDADPLFNLIVPCRTALATSGIPPPGSALLAHPPVPPPSAHSTGHRNVSLSREGFSTECASADADSPSASS